NKVDLPTFGRPIIATVNIVPDCHLAGGSPGGGFAVCAFAAAGVSAGTNKDCTRPMRAPARTRTPAGARVSETIPSNQRPAESKAFRFNAERPSNSRIR